MRRVMERIPAGASNRKKRLFADTAQETGPCHVLFEFQSDAKPAASLVTRVKKRMRQKGIRAQVVVQFREQHHSRSSVAHVHVTPLCASRSLALRFLLSRLGLSMANAMVVCCPVSLTVKGRSWRVGFAVSDMRSLVGGSQSVVFIRPSERPECARENN